MNEAPLAVKFRRFAEKHIVHPRLIQLSKLLDAAKPQHFHHSRSVGKQSDETHLGSLANNVERHKPAFNLHHRHRRSKISDAVELASVDIVRREMIQQIGNRVKPELLFKQFGAFGSDAFEVFQVCCPQSVH